jgi:hypothetical protein
VLNQTSYLPYMEPYKEHLRTLICQVLNQTRTATFAEVIAEDPMNGDAFDDDESLNRRTLRARTPAPHTGATAC